MAAEPPATLACFKQLTEDAQRFWIWNAIVNGVLPTGIATEATSQEILAKITDDPATNAKIQEIIDKLVSDPATSTNQDLTNGMLTSMLSDIAGLLSGIGSVSDDPATDGTSDWSVISLLKGIYIGGLDGGSP